MSKLPAASADQIAAWQFYGWPHRTSSSRSSGGDKPIVARPAPSSRRQVGEVRFVIGWMADQMVRMGWRIAIDGTQSWKLRLPDGTTVVSNGEQSNIESPDHPVMASRRVLESVEWNERTVREVTTNLYVAGELYYVLDPASDKTKGPGPHWRVVSVIRPDRDDIFKRAKIAVHAVWPHPADPEAPDAPLFGVLDVLEDMSWLSRLSRSQSANRVGMRGIIGYADSLATASGATGEQFWEDLNNAMSRSMDDPTDVSPVGIRGPVELVGPKDGNMLGLSWVIPEFPYDDRIDARMDKQVQRLSYGLPIPPEILMGLQAQSKATAFQVEGATYRAHIEPPALLVAQVARDALKLFLPEDAGEVEVLPDPTAILARRHSVADVIEAFDRGAVSYAYLRDVLGIPQWAQASEADLDLIVRVSGGGARAEVKDPASIAAKETATLAAIPATGEEDSPTPDELADMLHRIDEALMHELAGALTQAVARTKGALGARLRSSKTSQRSIPSGVTNEELPTVLGRDIYASLGIDVASTVATGGAPLLRWWRERLDQADIQVRNVLTAFGVEIAFNVPSKQDSARALEDYLAEAVWVEGSVDTSKVRHIIDAAGR